MKDDHIAHFGERDSWGQMVPFGLAQADRRSHVYIVGKTGVGKTTALRNIIAQDIAAGIGVGVIDPHGDLAEELLDLIPRNRTEHVVYFNSGDNEYPIGLNVLNSFPKDQSHLVASGVVGAFKSIWRDSWGPRMEYILYATVAALAECEGTTLLGIQRMLTYKRYRSWVVRQVKDPMVKAFWDKEFAQYDPEAMTPILNKVGQLMMAPNIRNVLGQVKSKINMRFMMDDSRIFIANLSKGKLGEDKSYLLGALLVNQFQLAAMSRSDIPENKRKDFNLFVDEFQNFASDSFGSILSEARKYRLCLTLSHQFTSQLSDPMRDSVFGNVGAIVSFRIGSADAEHLEREFGGTFAANQFSELSNHEILIKHLSGGDYVAPFRGKTLPPLIARRGRRRNIILRSREKYGTRRETVEEKISHWLRK